MTGNRTPTTSGEDRLRVIQSEGVQVKKADEVTIGLVDELKTLTQEILGRQLDRMFDGADDMLFEMAKRATSNDDQRVFFDTMRAVRLGRPNIHRSFSDGLTQHFAPDAQVEHTEQPSVIDFDELTLQESHAVEETIAVSNMATKAEGLYKNQIWELERRFNYMIREKDAPLSVQAIAPSTICAIFHDSIEKLDVEFAVRIIIYKLFDRMVISDLLELYTAALRFLDSHGVKAPAFSTAQRPIGASSAAGSASVLGETVETIPLGSPGTASMNGIADTPAGSMPDLLGGAASAGSLNGPLPSMATSSGAPAAMSLSAFDNQTLGSLQNVSGAGGTVLRQYSDSMLAADLEAASRGNIVQGWSVPQAFSYVQRTGLVGKMFNEILSDPNLPPSLKPQFDQLRFSVIKNALKDANFFANPNHPVRGIVNELATMAATARTAGQDSLQRIEDLVSQIRGQFDIAADTVKTVGPDVKSFEESEVERFIEQQSEQTRARRQAIILKTRRIVAEELQLRTAGMLVPDSVRPLLNSGWAPMMALHLLRHGPTSEEWQQGLDLLDQILGSIQLLPDEAERAALATRIHDDFVAVSMAEDRIEKLRAGLQEFWIAGDIRFAQNAAAAAAEAEEAAALELNRQFSIDLGPLLDSGLAKLESEGAAAETTHVLVEVDESTLLGNEEVSPDTSLDSSATTVETPQLETPQLESFRETVISNDPVSLLDVLVVPGNWFLVYDRQLKSSRWLKAVLRYRDKDLDRGSIAFAEFNGKNTLLVKAQDFLEDLIARRTEPIDLSPAAKHAFDEFLAAEKTVVQTTH